LRPTQTIGKLPLETCETINGSWGFNITDRSFKSSKQIIQYLVGDAGRNANFLLNIGPMPNGKIQPEFTDTLAIVGAWVKKNGESIYGTRGSYVPPQPWGVITTKAKNMYVHITSPQGEGYIFIPKVKEKVSKAVLFSNGNTVKFKQQPEGVFIYTAGLTADPVDTIVKLTVD
jgi:alpha-L-fucosidase